MQSPTRCDTEDTPTVSGADMLVRIGTELGLLAEQMRGLQVAVSAALTAAEPAGNLEDLQGLDLLTQTLEALEAVIMGMQHTAPPSGWPVNPDTLTRHVRLHSLQTRLRGGIPMPHPTGGIDLW